MREKKEKKKKLKKRTMTYYRAISVIMTTAQRFDDMVKAWDFFGFHLRVISVIIITAAQRFFFFFFFP